MRVERAFIGRADDREAGAERSQLKALRRSQSWLAGQKEAFQAAMNGAPLETSLRILVQTAMDNGPGDRRCAFYLANAEGTELSHVTGMSMEYARCVQGFNIGPESLACGLAVATGKPVITADVAEEPRWAPWLWLAREHGYRACWSFPVETAAGKIVGSFAMYFPEPRNPTPRDIERATALTQTASIIISRHQESEERARVTRALIESEANLAAELAAARQLQRISTELLHDRDPGRLFEKIVEAAKTIMRSDCSSMQVLVPQAGGMGELRLLAFRGFTPEAARHWERIRADSKTPCSDAFRMSGRTIVRDVTACPDRIDPDEVQVLLQTGIRACQSTPLMSRSGEMLGMISTHWREPHEPTERDLRLFDVVARQAADLIERKRAEDALERRAEQLKLLVDELNHRVKNTLATVQSMAMQSLRNSSDKEDAQRRFEARLIALSQAHDILTSEGWEGALLGVVVAASIAPYRNPEHDRFQICGPTIWLSPRQALALSMALHELSTNAVKYGSLSNDSGTVQILWDIIGGYGARLLRLSWTETGGPPVLPPPRRGFGSRLIERGLKQDLGGDVRLEFLSGGLCCTISAVLSQT